MTMAPNPNLQRLQQAGVCIWLDTLSRELLQTGEFAELIDNYGVTGATSNPTIFASGPGCSAVASRWPSWSQLASNALTPWSSSTRTTLW
jgi:hypothetical protein